MRPIRYRWCWGRTSFMRWRHWLSGSKNSTKMGIFGIPRDRARPRTSFKASQILMELPQVHKVVFVVDRKDLDYQTTLAKEFNSLEGCGDGTDNTQNFAEAVYRYLYWQKGQAGATWLIVTTIQKAEYRHQQVEVWKKDGRPQRQTHHLYIWRMPRQPVWGYPINASKNFYPRPDVWFTSAPPIFAENAVAVYGETSQAKDHQRSVSRLPAINM